MSQVWFSSDFHIDHKNIHKFRCKDKGFFRDFKDESEHREWLFDWVNDNVRKRDVLYLLGDIAFTEEALIEVGKLPGRKVLVKGNHCAVKSDLYSKVYDQVHGLTRYKHVWLSHAPIHPQELRGKFNFHGHTHYQNVLTETGEEDSRYMNCCVDNLMKVFNKPCVLFQDIVEYRSSQLGITKQN